jgi:predicted RNA-binding protein with PUA-like domain
VSPARAVRHWLVKTDAASFGWDDLWRAPGRTTAWDGVRNFQARNMLRDEMQPGDQVFLYHSNAEPSAVMGECVVVRGGYPDATAFDPRDSHFDPKSDPAAPTWYVVDLQAVAPFKRPLPLEALRRVRGLAKMELLRKGSRLSVMPVTAKEWAIVHALGMK